jgi:hypothetical protein
MDARLKHSGMTFFVIFIRLSRSALKVGKKILTFPQRIDEDRRMKRQKALSVGVNLSVVTARRAQVFSLSENLRSPSLHNSKTPKQKALSESFIEGFFLWVESGEWSPFFFTLYFSSQSRLKALQIFIAPI